MAVLLSVIYSITALGDGSASLSVQCGLTEREGEKKAQRERKSPI